MASAGSATVTSGVSTLGKVDPRDPKKAEISRNLQLATAAIDASGYCLFVAFAVLDIPEGLVGIVESLNGVLGANLTVDDVGVIGKQILDIELDFNKRAGFTAIDDRLPEFFREEKCEPSGEVFNVTDDELDSVF